MSPGSLTIPFSISCDTSADLDADDLGDDVARTLDDDAIALANVESAHLVEVVEGRATDRRRPHDHRREGGDRRERPHPPDIDQDVFDGRRRLFRGKLERSRPARAARD